MAGYSESAVCEAISAVAAWLGYSELRESQFRVVKQFLRGKRCSSVFQQAAESCIVITCFRKLLTNIHECL